MEGGSVVETVVGRESNGRGRGYVAAVLLRAATLTLTLAMTATTNNNRELLQSAFSLSRCIAILGIPR